MVGQQVSNLIYNLSSVGKSVRLPLGVDFVAKVGFVVALTASASFEAEALPAERQL
jgi:hypothetical protein